MNRTPVFLSVTVTIVLFAFLLLEATYNRHKEEQLFKAPSVSTLNTPEYSQSILQNSGKDIVFIENLGQIIDTEGEKRPDILFLTRSQGVDMYMTNTGISYVFRDAESGCRLDMEFVGMNKDISVKKELAVEQQYSYYTQEYPDGISPRAFKKITIENIYEGIDLIYYEKEDRMKYDFIIKAGVDASKIKMKYIGVSSMDIDNNGNVIIKTPMGEIMEEKPYTYSRNTGSEIESRYQVINNMVLFDIEQYDESEDIIIDPVRHWATYYGGNAIDYGYSICADGAGSFYLTGQTYSSNFPTQVLTGAYNQSTYVGDTDIFILKFNSSGERIWATYYGGVADEYGLDMCTDNSGNIYITGKTELTLPTQVLTGAYNQTSYGGGLWDAFILKFNSSGERIWATYYGGTGIDEGYSICTDGSGNLYVTGRTQGEDFPIQALTGAYNQTAYGGGPYDGFILKFNSIGERIWATYYGGSVMDQPAGICTDSYDNLYVTGWTLSQNFPLQNLTGAYNQTTLSSRNAFILKFNSSNERIWATYYGGTGGPMVGDYGTCICTDNSGNLYVIGHTNDNNFPTQTLTGAYNQTSYGGTQDAFILKFNSSCERLWSTYYGGNGFDEGKDICTDASGNLYVSGFTNSPNFPTQSLSGSYNQTTNSGGYDAHILIFNDSCARKWATYYGGSGDDGGWGICAGNSGNFYVTGETESSNFPILALTGAYNQSTSGGNADAFILKLYEFTAAFTASEEIICAGSTVSFTDQSVGNVISWDWTFEGGTPGTSTAQHPSVTYNTMGTYDVQLIISDGTNSDTLLEEDLINVYVLPAQANTPYGPAETCEGEIYDYYTDTVAGATLYEWLLEPSNAGTIYGSGTTGTIVAAIGWTGAYTVKVRASNICGSGAWSDTLAANLNHQPHQFNLTGGGPYCEGEPGCELILDDSETGVDYEVLLENVSTGVILPGTGDTLNFGFFTDEGVYTASGYTTYCSQQMAGENQIYIQALPGQAVTPAGPDLVCGSDTSEYFTTDLPDADSLIWILSPAEAGTLIPDVDSVEIIWSDVYSGIAFLSVYGTNACGDGPVSDQLEIDVNELPAPEISGNENVSQNSIHQYSSPDHTGATYDWTVTGGTIDAGQGTHEITVTWGAPGTGYVNLTETSAAGCEGVAAELVVNIDPVSIDESFMNEISIYPNPAKNILNIDLGTIWELRDGMISLMNIHGKMITSVKVTEGLRNISINTSSFAPGLYYLQIVEGERIVGARKVVIER